MKLTVTTILSATLLLGSFTADLDGRYFLAGLLLVGAGLELLHGVSLLRAQQTPLGRAGGGRR